MAAPPLANIFRSPLPGTRAPSAPPRRKPVPKRQKPFSFAESAKQLRSAQDAIKEERKKFFADVPFESRPMPKPTPLPVKGRGVSETLIYLQQQAAYRDSRASYEKWLKGRKQEWADIISGKAAREAHEEFLSAADKIKPTFGDVKAAIKQYGEKGAGAVLAQQTLTSQAQERKRLEAEWKKMLKDPEAYQEEQARKPKDFVGKISSAAIGFADPVLPQAVANDLRLITAGFLPGLKETGAASLDLLKGDPDAAERMLVDTLKQYRQNYVEGGWKGALSYAQQHPVLVGFDAAVVLGPLSKIASIGKLTKDFMRANPNMGVARAALLAQRESGRPGYASAQGIRGGIPGRTLKGKQWASETPRPVSRSPIGRGLQRVYDRQSELLDRSPLSETPVLKQLTTTSRAAAADRKALRRSMARQQAVLNTLQQDVAKYTTKGGLFNSMKRRIASAIPDPGRAEALISALEAGTDASKALTERVAALKNVLDQGIMWDRPDIKSPERDTFQSTLNERLPPEKTSALMTLTDSIARAQNPDHPARWYETHLADSSNMSVEDFMKTAGAAAAQFQMEAGHRVGLLETGKTRVIGPETVDAELAAADAARVAGNAQHAIYWSSKDGSDKGVITAVPGGYEKHSNVTRDTQMLTTQEASDFLKQGTDGRMWAGSEGVSRAYDVPVYYSELQRQVTALPDELRASDMEGRLRKRVTGTEWDMMGMDAFFERYDKGDKIPREDVQEFLSTPLNAYNFDELVRKSGDPSDPTRWDWEHEGDLVARTPTADEPYYELTMSLGLSEPGNSFSHYHWDDATNVVAHIRFHTIVDNDGKRAILIDEIQSDWASEYRRARKSVGEGVESERITQLNAQLEDTRSEIEAINADARDRAEGDEDIYHEYLDDSYDELNDLRQREERITRDLQMEGGAAGTPPPPPLGSKHIDAAVRRITRWASDTDAERIIVTPGEMQALRNGAYGVTPDGKKLPDDPDDPMRGEEWRDSSITSMSHEEFQAWGRGDAAETGSAPTFMRLYEKDIPTALEKNTGEKGAYREGIFNGYYGDQARGYAQGGEYPVGGYVIDFTPGAKERAMIPQRLFQRQPGVDGLPRGATEFLADGKTAMRLFEGASEDTVIHELAHVALADIPVEDRAVLAAHFGGPIEKWTGQQHEAFARGFEGYLYAGKAPTLELQQVFSKIRQWIASIWAAMRQDPAKYQLTPEVDQVYANMVLPKDRSPLTQEQRAQVTAQINDLEHALENLGDPADYEGALEAVHHMSQMIEEHGREIMLWGFDDTPDPDTGISPLDAAADDIDAMLERRRNAFTDLLRSMGIIQPGEQGVRAAGYYPNLSSWRVGGSIPIEPTKIAATGNTIGVPRPRPDAVNMRRNQFVRFQTGDLSMNPSVLFDVLRMRLKHLATLKLRQHLYDTGDPIKAGTDLINPPPHLMFIRDPKQEAVRIHERTRAALDMDEDSYAALVERGQDPSSELDVEDPDSALKDSLDDSVWDGRGKPPAWVRDERTVRTVPRTVATKLFGDIFPVAPQGKVASVSTIANSLARMSMLYAPGPIPGSRYAVRNFLQNAVLTGMTHPGSLRHSLYASRKLAREHPDLAQLIDAEAGSTRAEAALPEYYVKAQTPLQKRERQLSNVQRGVADVLSSAADNPFRRGMWIGYAQRYGFKGPEGWRRLLTSEDKNIARTRDLISQAVRDDLIDFDAMSPGERNAASHYFFLYPFIRGSLKWPFMYLREYPFRAGLLGSLAANQGQQREEEGKALAKTTSEEGRSDLGKGKQWEFGWLDPFAPAAQTLETIAALSKGLGSRDLTAMMQMLSPEYRSLVESLSGGASKTRPWSSLLASFVPGYSVAEKYQRGGSLSDQLLRHFSLSVEPSPSRLIQRKQAKADLRDAWLWAQQQGFQSGDATTISKSATAYEKFQDLDQRIDFSQKDIGEGSLRVDDLTPQQKLEREQQKALALSAAVAEGYPETRKAMTAEMRKVRSGTLEQLTAYNEQLQEWAFGPRNNLVNAWKRSKG